MDGVSFRLWLGDRHGYFWSTGEEMEGLYFWDVCKDR